MHDGRKLTFVGDRDAANVAVLTLHGRGDSARGILGLADPLGTDGVLYAAPEAEGNTWYPQSFLKPLADNEPYLTGALQAVGDALEELEQLGFAAENVVLLGFSQGACLAVEFAARNARRYRTRPNAMLTDLAAAEPTIEGKRCLPLRRITRKQLRGSGELPRLLRRGEAA